MGNPAKDTFDAPASVGPAAAAAHSADARYRVAANHTYFWAFRRARCDHANQCVLWTGRKSGRRGRAMAVRGIGRGARGRARQEANWVPFDERPYIQPPSPLRPQAPPYVPLQTQQQQLPPPVYTVPPLGVPAGNHPQQVTPEAAAEMIQAALTQRDVPPMPLLQKPYPD